MEVEVGWVTAAVVVVVDGLAVTFVLAGGTGIGLVVSPVAPVGPAVMPVLPSLNIEGVVDGIVVGCVGTDPNEKPEVEGAVVLTGVVEVEPTAADDPKDKALELVVVEEVAGLFKLPKRPPVVELEG